MGNFVFFIRDFLFWIIGNDPIAFLFGILIIMLAFHHWGYVRATNTANNSAFLRNR